jgi:hypothetical protein
MRLLLIEDDAAALSLKRWEAEGHRVVLAFDGEGRLVCAREAPV